MKISNCQCEQQCQYISEHYAIIEKVHVQRIFRVLDDENSSIVVPHIYRYEKTDGFTVIPIKLFQLNYYSN